MKIIFFLLFGLSFFTCLQAEVVDDIIVDGNNRVNTETIKMFSNIKIGDDVSNEILNNSLKELYKTNFFEDVNMSIYNSVLTINVKENPIIQNLILTGIKNNTLENLILDRISTKSKKPFIENILENDLNVIKELLQNTGYFFSDVSLLKKESQNNSVDIIFEINLGEKAFISEINFVGNKIFKKRKLLNIITSEENKFWKFISSKKLINKERIDLDKRLLINFYKNNGYYNVKILDETIQIKDDNTFNLVFNIDAGQKFFFSDFKINLPPDYEAKYFEKSILKLNNFIGKHYSLKVIEKILKELETIADSRQYEFVNANIDEEIISNDKILINIEVKDDEYKYYVQKIDILGNNITIEDVIRNELIIDEGDPLNQILFNKSINNIKSLNIFKNVNSTIMDGSDVSQKIIKINVDEKPTGEISLGAGIGTSGASTAFGIRENNFLGQGIKLDANLSLSEETLRGLFSYTKPNFKNTDRDLILSIESQETDRLADYGYKNQNTGFSIGTRFEHLEDFFISPQFSFNYESIDTSSTASSLLRKQDGDYLDIEMNYGLVLDKRNQSFQPSDGYISSFYQTLPFNIKDNQTLINNYEFTSYHEYFGNNIATMSILAKTSNSLGEKNVRISDRLYIPSRKLRGFESGKVGPIDNGDFVGGNYVTSLNLATTLPIFESFESMSFNLFYDAANVWGVDYNSSLNDSSALRSATGIGVDWYTPIGPLNFSLSQALTKKSTDKTENFRFNLGTTF